MQVQVFNSNGKAIGTEEISDYIFSTPFNNAVVHQAVVRQLANARLGLANTKTRGEVAGSTRKLYRQKHTGRARRGSIRSPLLRGGGIVFGPKPHSYRLDMPKKMRRLALRCLLANKVAEGNLIVLDKLELKETKTKEVVNLLKELGIQRSALLITELVDRNLVRAASNISNLKTLSADLINVADIINKQTLIVTLPAVRKIEEIWGR